MTISIVSISFAIPSVASVNRIDMKTEFGKHDRFLLLDALEYGVPETEKSVDRLHEILHYDLYKILNGV